MGMTVEEIVRLGARAQKQIAAQLAGKVEQRKPSKYHNKKTAVTLPGGEEYIFDSIREAKRYEELLLMLNSGQIADLKLQPQLTIQESYIDPQAGRVRAIRYTADFSYKVRQTTRFPNGDKAPWIETIFEDSKGKRTETYKMKRKLVQERLGITILEV